MTFSPPHQLYVTHLSTQISNSEINVTSFLFSGEYSGRSNEGGPGGARPTKGGTGEPALDFAIDIIPTTFPSALTGILSQKANCLEGLKNFQNYQN
jgi:hypothetical protein